MDRELLHVGVLADDETSAEELEHRAGAMERTIEVDGKVVARVVGTSRMPELFVSCSMPDKLEMHETNGGLRVAVEFTDDAFYGRARADGNVAGLLRLEICRRLGR